MRFGIPYIIVEHWSRYLLQNFNFKGVLRKAVSRVAVRRASCIMPVSRKLGDAMRGCGLPVPRETRYEYDSQGRLICSEFDFPDGLGSSYYKYYYYNNIKIVKHFEIDCLELYAFVYEVE